MAQDSTAGGSLAMARRVLRIEADAVMALADRLGVSDSAAVLADLDAYYRDRSDGPDAVVTALVQRLSEPNPRDSRVTTQLTAYKGLVARWHQWETVVADCAALADAIVERRSEGGA